MKIFRSLSLVLGLALASFSAQAAVVGAIWDTPTSGTLDGVGFTVSGFGSPSFFDAALSGSNFSAAPLATTQRFVSYQTFSPFTVTFDSAVTDLLLYTVGWRGTSAGAPNPIYVFSHDFELLSGLDNATIDPFTIRIPNRGFGSGIVRFTTPITSLSVTTNGTGFSNQGLTFGLDQPIAPIPLPATGLLLIGGLAGLTQLRRLSRRG